jgi:hypothetical protein
MCKKICAKTIKSNQQQSHTLTTQIDRKIFDDLKNFYNQENTLEKDEEDRRSSHTQSLECNFLDKKM